MPGKEHFEKGKRLYSKGQYKGAIVAFTLAIEQEPNNAEYYYERAMSFFHLNNTGEALEDMSLALKHDPKNPFRFSSRAYMRDKAGDTLGGVEDYRKAVELDPEDAIAHNNLGLLEEKLGYQKAAEKRFAIADEIAATKGMLGDMQYVAKPSPKPSEAPAVQQPQADTTSGWRAIKQVFVSAEGRKDFARFIRNGFRIK